MITKSSAYAKRRMSRVGLTGIPLQSSLLRKATISFKNNANKRGLKISPCKTPMSTSTGGEKLLELRTRISASLYKFLIISINFELTPIFDSLFQSSLWLIESNALLKSTNKAKTFLEGDLLNYDCMRVFKQNVLSKQLLLQRKPD